MSASSAYVAKSGMYKTVPFDGITNITTNQNGQLTALLTDAETSIEAHFIDGVQADITITFTNHTGASALYVGETGALVVVFQQRAAGKGAVGGADITMTAANATITGISIGGGVSGHTDVSVTFACAGPSSVNPIIFS